MIERDAAQMARRVRLGLPIRSVPRALLGATRESLLTVRPSESAPRAAFLADPSTGDRWFVFARPGNTTVVKATRALAEALSGVRMGELVVDLGNARDILDRVNAMESRVSAVEATLRSLGPAGTASSLPARLAEWWALRRASAPQIDRVRGSASRALLLRTPQSISDLDLEAFEKLENGAIELEEVAHGITALPGTTTKPRDTGGTRTGTGFLDSIPWWGWALGGTGLLGIVALAAGAFSRPAGPVVIRASSGRS